MTDEDNLYGLDQLDKLDDSWITDFEKGDNAYSYYYKSDIYFVKITCIYVDKENALIKIKEEKFFMKNPNIISREELVAILKKNSLLNNKRFSLLSLLKYNINISPQDIRSFLLSDNINLYKDTNKYISVLKNIDEIDFDKTINMYHDLNNIFIIYYEKFVDSSNKSNVNNINTTKKVYLNKYSSGNNHKKTVRI
jgi:hypothetical protein